MSQPIITTDISHIRPLFEQGVGENINRYSQLKSLFAEGMEYTVLAEPKLDRGNKITWHTEFEGTPVSFSNLTEEEQIAAKSTIKNQVNKLYKAAFHKIYRSSMNDVADIFSVIDSCIEIPDYDNIYRIQNANGECNFVLIKWGFIGDEFNAPSGLIKKLVPTKVDTVKIRVIKNRKPAVGEKISIVCNGKEMELTTWENGYVYLHDMPLGDKFSAYVGDKDKNMEHYMCDGRDDYQYLINTRKCDMNFVVRDAKGVPISNAEIIFTYDDRTYFETTDANGRICLKDIPEGTEVQCKQRNNQQVYVCDFNSPEYEFEGVRYIAEIDISVITARGEIVPGAQVRFDYADKSITLHTDINGRVSVDNMPPDTEISIECSSPQYQVANTKLFTHEGLNMAEIKLRELAMCDNMTIRVVDEQNVPIANTTVRCGTDDTKTDLVTNENGEIVLSGVKFNSNVECTQIVNGLGSHRHNFIFSDSQQVYVLKGVKIPSEVTLLNIHVINHRKEEIPNLRVTIDDGHNVLNRITNGQGRISVEGLVQGKQYTISTDYNGKHFENIYVPDKASDNMDLVLGRSKYFFLVWLLPLLLLLGWLLLAFVVPAISAMLDAMKDKEVSVRVRSAKDSTVALAGANVVIAYNGTEVSQSADSNGVCRFVLHDPQSNLVSMKVSAAEFFDIECPLYVSSVDTAVALVPVPKGITLTVKDEETSALLSNAKVHIEYNGESADLVTDAEGQVNFEKVPMDTTLQLKIQIQAADHETFASSFYFEKEKTVYVPKQSTDIRDIPVPCGTKIESSNTVHSVVQTVKLSKNSGKLTLYYNMYTEKDELIVYSGPASKAASDKIIYKTDGFVGGKKMVSFSFDTPDGLITVRVNGGNDSTTAWDVKVNCPK